MTRSEARNEINKRKLTDFIPLKRSLKAGPDKYVCPICKSGEKKNKTGALHIDPKTNRVKCFADNCFSEKGEDTIGALKIIWECNETEAIRRAGYTLDEETSETIRREPKQKTERQEDQMPDYSFFYKDCHEALKKNPAALAYLHMRHIADDSIERFNLGYCPNWRHSKAPEQVPTSDRIIIPRTKRTYTARQLDDKGQYKKMIEGTQKDLFNLEALGEAKMPIICEGELDAISLYQSGADAVIGLGAVTNTGGILEEANKHPGAVYILALDNDDPGKNAQRKLAADLKKAGLDVISWDPKRIYGEAKDANEALVKDPQGLTLTISLMQEEAREKKAARDAELRKRTGEGMLEEFLFSVTSEARPFEPIPTGIKDIDRALEGGFIRKTLVTLGAPPAMGKTALAQWIFENIAANGQDVLYINLEMAREQLLARSLSRIAYEYESKDYSTLEILRGYDWTDTQEAAIRAAANRYKEKIAPHFIYNPDGVTNAINSILQAMKADTERLKAQGRLAPLVCIDYLQLIDSGEKDATEGLKNVIFKLKDFTKQENTVVFIIIANNRASNKSGSVEIDSGRDTSSIEYSGDVMLGLVYTAIEDGQEYETDRKDKDGNPIKAKYDLNYIRQLKAKAYETGEEIPNVCKEISLKVLKSRFTGADRKANLIFDGKHSTFRQIEKAEAPEM